MISAMASSTTLRVLENGALKTAIPRLGGGARSTWLVPMQNAPTASRSVGAGQDPVGDLGLRPDAEQADPWQRLDEVILAERRGSVCT